MTAARARRAGKGTYGRYGRPRRRRTGRSFLSFLAVCALVVVVGYAVYGLVTRPPQSVERAIYPLKYGATIRQASAAYGVDPTMVAGVIYAESRYDPQAVSRRGARGLMQITPQTADFIQRNSGISGDFTDPETNIRMGTWQLGYLQRRYLGDERATLAAYNSGTGNVDGWLAKPGFDLHSDIPFTETRHYVDKVLAAQAKYRELYGRNLDRNQ